MLSDLCSSTQTSFSRSVLVSLAYSLSLSVLCRVCTDWLFVYLQTDRLCFDQIWTPGATVLLSGCLCVDRRTHTFACTHSFSHTSERQMMWDREKGRERSLWCAQHFLCSCFKQQPSQNLRGEAQKRLEDSWLTLQTLTGADGEKHRGRLIDSFPLDFETGPHSLAPPTDRHPRLAFKVSTLLRWLAVFTYLACVRVRCDWERVLVLGEILKCQNWLLRCPSSDPSLVRQQADGIQVVRPRVDGAEVEGVVGTMKWRVTSFLLSQSF